MQKKEDRRTAMTKRMLKDALTELLRETDIYHVSIRELCEKADVNRTTFYKYYGSQFDLLSEMERDLLQSIERTLCSQQDFRENIIERVIAYLETDIDFIRLLLNSNVDPQFPEKLFSLEPIRRMSGDSRPGLSDSESEYYFCFIQYGAYEMVHKWVNKEKRESPAQVAAMINRFICG